MTKVRFTFDIPFNCRFASDTIEKKRSIEKRPLVVESDPINGRKQIGILDDPNPVLELDEENFVYHITCQGKLYNAEPFDHLTQAEDIEFVKERTDTDLLSSVEFRLEE
jgi:hypothetical protein